MAIHHLQISASHICFRLWKIPVKDFHSSVERFETLLAQTQTPLHSQQTKLVFGQLF